MIKGEREGQSKGGTKGEIQKENKRGKNEVQREDPPPQLL